MTEGRKAEVIPFDALDLAQANEFDKQVIGEVIESYNQTVAWWEGLNLEKRRELFNKRLVKRPKK